MFLFNDLFRLIHNLLNLNIALFTFIRVTIIIILIVISMSELPFYSVVIVSNIIQLLMQVLLWHFVVKCLKFLLLFRHFQNILLLFNCGFFWFDSFLLVWDDWLLVNLFSFGFSWFSGAYLVDNWWFLGTLLHLLSTRSLLLIWENRRLRRGIMCKSRSNCIWLSNQLLDSIGSSINSSQSFGFSLVRRSAWWKLTLCFSFLDLPTDIDDLGAGKTCVLANNFPC